MLDDLFSHKIHASNLEAWKRNLVKLAEVFLAFDNQPFKRDQFDQALNLLSPNTARSPFRDIYSIYMSILGVGHIIWDGSEWKCHISETSRRYLIGNEPNVEAFCRLQLSIYQRPDGRGQQYNRNGPSLEHQSQQNTLNLINDNYRICPIRLILKIFEAKARLQRQLPDEIIVVSEEIYTLVNCQELRNHASPSINKVIEVLEKYYNQELPIVQGEKRFSFLEATGLFTVDRDNTLRLYSYNDYTLNRNRDIQIEAIKTLDCFFEDFNQCTDVEQVCDVLASGNWANYFDACKTLSAKEVQEIAGEILLSSIIPQSRNFFQSRASSLPQPRKVEIESTKSLKEPRLTQVTDPEITRILRERRNAWHDFLVQKMKNCLEQAGLEPWETDLIDLGVNLININQIYSQGFPFINTYLEGQCLPYFQSEMLEGLTFIFEIKSSDASILVEQVRKAVSQLYEYRYRYYTDRQIKENAVLVIVLQTSPEDQSWLKDYLLFDRHIAVCWLRKDNSRFDCFDECQPILEPLISC